MNLENESKEFLDFLVEHCEANKIDEINEDELEDLKEKFINEAIKIEDIEALLGDGKPNGKYTKFTLKDGTYVLYHPTIGLEYRAKDGSLLPHNWKTVKAMKKELVMAGMINESDNKKMIESLLFKIKAKYGYNNLKVDYENGVVTGADEDIKFDISGDNDYIELIETLQRMLKFGDEEVNEAKNKLDNGVYLGREVKLKDGIYTIISCSDKSGKNQDCLLMKNNQPSKEVEEFVTKEMLLPLNEAYTIGDDWEIKYKKELTPNKLDMNKMDKDFGWDSKAKKALDNLPNKFYFVIYERPKKSGQDSYYMALVDSKLEKMILDMGTHPQMFPKFIENRLNEAQESNITTALKEIANGNTGAGIEAFKSAFLDRLSLNQDFQRITSELK
jgi:hypothetical protein